MESQALIRSARGPWVGRILTEPRRAWLARARSHRWLVLLSVLLCSTSLGLGLRLDDHAHRLLVRGDAGARAMWDIPPHALDMFRFVDGDGANYLHGLEMGAAPWFTSPHLRLAFARPLASLTHVFDYTVLEGSPWAMHLHSLLWLALLGLAVAQIVVRLEHGWTAGLLLVFYLLDVGHGVPAGWLAGRNHLIAGVLGALAFDAHLRWRLTDARRAAHARLLRGALPAGLFAIALAGGESALGWLGFFLAFALVRDPAGPRRGMAALLPLVLVVAVWRVIYRALGYGAAASSLYVDPGADPLSFARAVCARLPTLLLGQLGGPPAGIASLGGPAVERAVLVITLVGLALLAAVLVPALRRDRHAWFWALGAILAAVPVSATQPHGRLMLIGGLGTAGVMARLIAHVVDRGAQSPRTHRAVAAFWLLIGGVFSPLRLPLEAHSMSLVAHPWELAIGSVPREAEGRTLVVVAVPDPMFMCGQLLVGLASRNQPRPARVRCLAGSEGPVSVSRPDERTLIVRVPAGLMSPFFAPMLRDHPFEPGWALSLHDVHYELAERDATGAPLALRARFATPLEDPDRVFVAWSVADRAFRPFPLPAIGASISLTGQPVTELMFGD